jgi:hypothetical protein
METMDDPRRRQATLNVLSQGSWDAFSGHRARVTELLLAGAGKVPGRLCVLGAGNTNDLDLPALLDVYREVHLVDLDALALARSPSARGLADSPSIRIHGGVDLTGMIDVVAGWSPRAAIPAETLSALAQEPGSRVAASLPGPFDVVVSTCLLTQLVGSAFHAVGENHSQFKEMVRAIRIGHLRLMHRLAAPGGTVVLVTDVVSSDTLPGLSALPESSLPGLLPRLSHEGNVFHGADPLELWSIFQHDRAFRDRLEDLESIAPWRWDLGVRLYLAWAVNYRVRGESRFD